jgi:hypothetical protein
MDQDELDFLSREKELLGDDAKLFGNPLISEGEDGTTGVITGVDGIAGVDGITNGLTGVDLGLVSDGVSEVHINDTLPGDTMNELEKTLESVHITYSVTNQCLEGRI